MSACSSSEAQSERQEVKTGGHVSTGATAMARLRRWAQLLIVRFTSDLLR